MPTGEIVSIIINIVIGIYFAHFYTRSVRNKLGEGKLPPFFLIMVKLMPPLGYLLIIGTLMYGGLRWYTLNIAGGI